MAPKRLAPSSRFPRGGWQETYRAPNGKERQGTFRTRGEAERWKAEQTIAKNNGDWIDPKVRKVTVGELGKQLLATKADPNTLVWNRSMLRHVNARWEHDMVGTIGHLDVQAWVGALEAEGKSADTVRGAFRVLHEIVALALRGRVIGHDPCLGVRLPKVSRREMLFLSPAQVDLLARTLDTTWPDQGWGVLVRFAAYTGCRAGEIGGLHVKHLDLLRHRAHIVMSRKSYGEDGAPKTGKARWVDLPRQLCDELAAHLASRPHEPDDRVWTGDRGGPLAHHWFYGERFKPAVDALSDESKLPVTVRGDKRATLRFHDLRHTCVALLIGKGAQQYEVMEHLGHTNIQTTINTYGHLFPSVRDRIRAALEDTWDEVAAK